MSYNEPGNIFRTIITQSLREQNTPLNTAYFCQKNLDLLQRTLQEQIYAKIQHRIDRQDDRQLLTIMRGIYIENDVSGSLSVADQVKAMNALVVKVCLPQIASGIKAYQAYIVDASTLPMPISRGVSTNMAGSRSLQPNIGF